MVVANNLPDVTNGNVIIGARLLNRRSPQGQRLIATTNYIDGRLWGLPEGWLVENRPRTPKNSERADNFYYEPGTHKQFRSMQAVKRHLQLIATEKSNKRQPGTSRCSKVTNSKPKRKRKNGSSFNHANIAENNLLTLADAIRD